MHYSEPSCLCATERVLLLGLSGLGSGHYHRAMAAAIATTDQRIPMCDVN